MIVDRHAGKTCRMLTSNDSQSRKAKSLVNTDDARRALQRTDRDSDYNAGSPLITPHCRVVPPPRTVKRAIQNENARRECACECTCECTCERTCERASRIHMRDEKVARIRHHANKFTRRRKFATPRAAKDSAREVTTPPFAAKEAEHLVVIVEDSIETKKWREFATAWVNSRG